MRRDIGVYAGWESNRKIGTLYTDVVRGNETFFFRYEKDWITKRHSLELDPSLPVMSGNLYSPDGKMFGLFEDACPDRWGRRLIDRREQYLAARDGRPPQKQMESDYLLKVQDISRVGGLRFSLDGETYLADAKEMPVPPMARLRELEQISLGYEKGRDKDQRWITSLVEPGSSLGGARPKANVIDEKGEFWIAKFPSRHDDYDVGAWEKTVHDLAALCGLCVPEAKLCKFSDLGSTYLAKRFDREKGERLHYASAMTMLGARDGKTDDMGYLDIAQKVVELTRQTDKMLEELFSRAAFDIAVSNQDNHLRNHGFLLRGGQWELAPAFDINPVPNAQYLSLNVDFDSKEKFFGRLLSTGSLYHLDEGKAAGIIRDISCKVAGNWERLAKANGIAQRERKEMAPAFSEADKEMRRAQTMAAANILRRNRDGTDKGPDGHTRNTDER